jgi:hypothetical protein
MSYSQNEADLLKENESLRQQLAVKYLEEVQLREAWDDLLEDLEINGMHSFEPYIESKAKFKALSTTFTPDHLMAWLGEPEIWLTQKEYETLKRAQKTERETVPLYAPKLGITK